MNRAWLLVVALGLVACDPLIDVDESGSSTSGQGTSTGSDQSEPGNPTAAPPNPTTSVPPNPSTSGPWSTSGVAETGWGESGWHGTSSGWYGSSGSSGWYGSSGSSETGFEPSCGDGMIQPGEQCDGEDLQGLDCTKLGLGFGELFCDPEFCTFDTSACEATGCGDGIVQPGEQCDGANLQGFTCGSLGLGVGDLACQPDLCVFDTSGCFNS